MPSTTPGVVAIDHTTQYLAFAGPIILALLAWMLKKLDAIHVLVNSRLTAALDKIDILEVKLQNLTGRLPTGEPLPKEKPTDLIGRRSGEEATATAEARGGRET